MKNVLLGILIIFFIGFGFSLFKGMFVHNEPQLVPDSYIEVTLNKVIDSNTYKVNYLEDPEPNNFIIKLIYTDINNDAEAFIEQTLIDASHIYIEDDNHYVDTYQNPEVWVWYMNANGELKLLQEELYKKGYVETLNSYSTKLLYQDRFNENDKIK